MVALVYCSASIPAGLATDQPRVARIGKIQSCLMQALNTLFGRDGAFRSAASKSRESFVDRSRMATLLEIPSERLFPSNTANRFHLWRYGDNSAKIAIDRQEDAFGFLGEMIAGMDPGYADALISGKSTAAWKRLVSVIENGGEVGDVPLDIGRLAVSAKCTGFTCYFTVTDRSKKMIDYDSFSRFDGKVILDPRYEAKDYYYLLQHQLPQGLPAPSDISKKYGVLDSGHLHYAIGEAKRYFRSEEEFCQFIDLARKAGFDDAMEFAQFLGVNGYHRGVAMVLDQVNGNVPLQQIKSRVMDMSQHRNVGAAGGGWMPKLTFENLPHIKIYRGTTLSESELGRLFKMNWQDYYEARSSARRGSGFSPFGGGKYFTIDHGTGQRFAISNANDAPNVRSEPWYSILVEADVPTSRLRKDSHMSRWDVGEFQYDPTQIKPEEVSSFTFYLKNGSAVRVPGELLRGRDFEKVRRLLSDAGIPDENIGHLLGDR